MKLLPNVFKKSQKSYYRKMFLFYAAFTVIVICMSSFILMHFLNKNLENEIYLSNKRLVTQIQIFSDNYLIERINNLVLGKILDTSQDVSILDFINSKYANAAETLFKVQQSASGDLLANPFIHSIYFYRKADDTVISSREGIVSGILSADNRNRNYINTELIRKSMDPAEDHRWISPAENRTFWGDRAVISFSQPIPLYSDKSTLKGSVIVNIEEEVFFKAIGKVTDTNTGELMIVDSAGRIFVDSEKAQVLDPAPLPYMKEIQEEDSGFYMYNDRGKYVGITWVKSSLNDWKYVFTVPIEILNKELIVVRQFMVLVILVTVIFSVTGLNIITTHLYKPFRKLISNAGELFNIKSENKNELAFVNDVLQNLSTRVREMDRTLEENKTLIQYKLMIDLLYGNIRSDDEIAAMMELAGLNLVSGPYILLLTEIRQEVFDGLSIEQSQFVSYNMVATLNDFLSYPGACASISHSRRCFATLMGTSDERELTADLYQLLYKIRSELGLSVNLAVSGPVDRLSGLAEVYALTADYLKYSYIYEYENVFTPGTVRQYESRSGGFGLEDLNRMEAQLRSGRIEAIKEELCRQSEEIRKYGYSYAYSRNVFSQIADLFCRVSMEQGLGKNLPDRSELVNGLSRISSMDACIGRIIELLDAYQEGVLVRNSALNQEVIEKVNSYVQNHIEEQLSLNTLAEVFDITPNYLSRIYKEVTGVHFSDFLIHTKFQKAAELLSSSKSRDVAHIAEKLGYVDMRYFTRLFREKYGMTPLQYIKKNSPK